MQTRFKQLKQPLTAFVGLTLFLVTFMSSGAQAVQYKSLWMGSENQKDSGSCAIFAVVGVLDAEYAMTFKKRISFSEADLLFKINMTINKDKPAEKADALGKTDLAFDTAINTSYVDDDFTLGVSEDHGTALPDLFDRLQTYNALKTRRQLSYSYILSSLRTLDSDLKQCADDVRSGRKPIEVSKNNCQKLMLKNENWIRSVYDIPDATLPDATWLPRLSLKTDRIFAAQDTVEAKREAVVETLRCKPAAVVIDAAFYGTTGDHAQIIAGYDPKSDVFTIRNSWGGRGFLGLEAFETHAAKDYLPKLKELYHIEDPEHPCVP